MDKALAILEDDAIRLLQRLIRCPSFSTEEEGTTAILASFLGKQAVPVDRLGNNLLACNLFFDTAKPTILLNSHHDTVKPNTGYTMDPFDPVIREGQLFGLGSNDAGGPLVALIAAFLNYYNRADLRYNLVLAATAEEEISGTGGIEAVLPHIGTIDCAIVGEPTRMELAVAERGPLVIDAVATGRSGHAARDEGENALYIALDDIAWIRSNRFPLISDMLGAVKTTVTVIETDNKAHNVVPSSCHFVIDVRVNERYTHEEVLSLLRSSLRSELTPRSVRLRSSIIPVDHPLVMAGMRCGRKCYGSPTTSDKALMPFPALKMGPGDSARSHTANEFIYLEEIREGIGGYIQLLNQLL